MIDFILEKYQLHFPHAVQFAKVLHMATSWTDEYPQKHTEIIYGTFLVEED